MSFKLLRCPLFVLVTHAWLLSSLQAVTIQEISYQARPHYLVKTSSCVWYFDRAGGGFSRLIDRDGRDWIAFRKEPLTEYPASAAAGYRGIPNAVFIGPDKGAGHPGFDQCESIVVGENSIRTTSKSNQWSWTWSFTDDSATFSMERTETNAPWWFLYEGPIAGSFEPQHKLWGADSLGLRKDQPSNQSQFFGTWQTLYVADQRVPRALAIHQHMQDDLPDNFWYLGSSDGGSAAAPDGMVVAGFGRGPGTKPQLTGNNQRFTLGFVEFESVDQLTHESIMNGARALFEGKSEPGRKRVTFWYGSEQSFGRPGLTQRWINVLGQIEPPDGLESATFRLDEEPPQALEIGTDLHRLAQAGDFNVELPADQLLPGSHQVTVTANWDDGQVTSAATQIIVWPPAAPWPLPYEVDFTEDRFASGGISEVQQAAQIIDGHWSIEDDGLRTLTPWYDRVVGFGDNSWTDYEATVELTIHGFTPPQPGPPTYDVSHCGLALRWYGHTADGRQPSRQWYPMGCQGELLLRNDHAACQWRALPGALPPSPAVYASGASPVKIGTRMLMMARVQTLSNGDTRYGFKHWSVGDEKPDAWFVENQEARGTDRSYGSLLIVPHNSDITIHRVRVTKL